MISYRDATPADWPIIAKIHAVSWQQHYRGVVSDHYLDKVVEGERQAVWKERFSKPNEKMLTIMAEEDEEVVGFSCTFLDYDDQYGAMLDNLHVLSSHQGKGIGRDLIYKSAKAVNALRPETSLYLYVLEANEKATIFYEKMGGVQKGSKNWETPDGNNPLCFRYVWEDLKSMSEKI